MSAPARSRSVETGERYHRSKARRCHRRTFISRNNHEQFTDQLHEQNIPFILLDSYMPDLRPLSFFGQDSFCSGFFAAKMLMMIACKEKEIMLMRQTKDGSVVSKQQDNREVGFRHYMHDHFPKREDHRARPATQRHPC